ncbi:MAG: helix-turn-helix domain-containing protein [Oceanipulchritudo sp.]
MPANLPSFSELTHRLLRAYDDAVQPRFLNLLKYGDASYTSWYIRSGSVTLSTDRTTHLVKPDHWVFLDPFVIRTHAFSPGTRILSIAHQIEWRGGFAPYPATDPIVLPERDRLDLLASAEALVSTLRSARENTSLDSACRREGAFFSWLALWHGVRQGANGDASPSGPPADARLQAALALLSRRPGLGVIDYPYLQKTLRLSRSQIDRLFHQHLGLTPRAWCQRQTLALAQQALLASPRSIKEIAHDLRFHDASHFAKWFRSQTGRSPSQMRRGL